MLDSRKYLNAFQLKLIAACAMLIDHTVYVFYSEQLFLRSIGRLAFPIFAYMVAIGYSRTRNLKNYIFRMLLFAILAQVPYVFMIGDFKNIPFNVIFTLLFGLISIYAIDKGGLIIGFIVSLALALFAQFGGFDHYAFGVLLVIAFYYTRDSKLLRNISSTILILLFTLSYLIPYGVESWIWIIILFYLFAIPFINLYNNKKGIDNPFTKWFFYVFYPIHISLIVLLSKIL